VVDRDNESYKLIEVDTVLVISTLTVLVLIAVALANQEVVGGSVADEIYEPETDAVLLFVCESVDPIVMLCVSDSVMDKLTVLELERVIDGERLGRAETLADGSVDDDLDTEVVLDWLVAPEDDGDFRPDADFATDKENVRLADPHAEVESVLLGLADMEPIDALAVRLVNAVAVRLLVWERLTVVECDLLRLLELVRVWLTEGLSEGEPDCDLVGSGDSDDVPDMEELVVISIETDIAVVPVFACDTDADRDPLGLKDFDHLADVDGSERVGGRVAAPDI